MTLLKRKSPNGLALSDLFTTEYGAPEEIRLVRSKATPNHLQLTLALHRLNLAYLQVS